MELKHINPNGEIVLASLFNPKELCFLEIIKIEFINKSNMLFFSRSLSMIACKRRSSITFTLLMQIEQIKALNADKNLSIRK